MKDVTTTAEVLADLVAEEALAENEEALAAEVSVQEKKADSEAIETQLQEKAVLEALAVPPTDQKEKVVSIAIVRQEKHQVLSKEKASLQDAQKGHLIPEAEPNRAELNQEKEDLEKVNTRLLIFL